MNVNRNDNLRFELGVVNAIEANIIIDIYVMNIKHARKNPIAYNVKLPMKKGDIREYFKK